MKRIALIISIVLFVYSCRPVMLAMYGVKKPDIENPHSIIAKAVKFTLDTSNIVTVNEFDYLSVMNGQGIPDAKIFDSSGRYIEYRRSETDCNAGLFEFIPALSNENNYISTDSILLSSILEKCRDLYGNKLKEKPEADFYVLIYWTVWTGKLNKDHVKIWETQAHENKKCKIAVIKVNLDLQQYWDENERNQIINILERKE